MNAREVLKKKSVCVDSKVNLQITRGSFDLLSALALYWVGMMSVVLLSLAPAVALFSKSSLFTYIVLVTTK